MNVISVIKLSKIFIKLRRKKEPSPSPLHSVALNS
jgi:hypothetical protein